MSEKKIVSLIIPCYNEEKNILPTFKKIKYFWNENLSKYDLEIIFVDDGSIDNTFEKILQISQKENFVKIIQFSKNFGKEIATSAGIANSIGDCVIIFDADLQYPIDKLPDFIKKWEEGYDVVVGIRDGKKTNNIVEKLGSYLFYKIVKLISDVKLESGALDYRLIDKIVIKEFNKFTERGRMTRALIDWLGFKRTFIKYKENSRNLGTPSYSLAKRIKLAFSTFVATSLLPLKLAGYLGLFISLVSGILGVILLVGKYILQNSFANSISGSVVIGLVVVFLTGINLICLGLIALYIANIHIEVSNRPLYIIRKKINFKK